MYGILVKKVLIEFVASSGITAPHNNSNFFYTKINVKLDLVFYKKSMTVTQNFDFIDFKVGVEFVDKFEEIDTGYISRICFLKEDASLSPPVIPPTAEESKDITIDADDTYEYAKDVSFENIDTFPELSDYFYKERNKSIDVLTVGDTTDMSAFIQDKIKELNGRCFTIVVESSIDHTLIDPNFVTAFNGAFIVSVPVVDANPPNKWGYLFIEDVDPDIRNTELLHFVGWLFNRVDFLGQVTMTQLDYETTYWLKYDQLQEVLDAHYTGLGNQNGNTYVSSFFIGDDDAMNFYRKEMIKRSIQQAIFNLLTLRNVYDQLTVDKSESVTKKVINSFTWTDSTKTIVKHNTIANIRAKYGNDRIIPVETTFGLQTEVDKVIVQLYDITNFYAIGG